MIRLGVIFGGRSGEHEVSLMSATSVLKALPREKFDVVTIGITKHGQWMLYEGDTENIESGAWEKSAIHFNIGNLSEVIDFALPILHGPYGEDGTIQGFFEMIDVPYAGCGVLASAAAMDKAVARELFAQAGLPICRHKLVFSEAVTENMGKLLDEIEECLPYSVFVKPANMGSSVGISKAGNRRELEVALQTAAKYDRRILVEEAINCRELEAAVIGNNCPETAVVGEILPSAEFYDYTAKYFDGGKSRLCIPADISKEAEAEIKDIAKRAYEALDCAGFARIDFFMDKDTGKIYLNEVNTIPGFTKISMFPLLWREAGLTYSRLLERIVDFGYERYHAKNNR